MREKIEKLLKEIEHRHIELDKTRESEPRGGYTAWATKIGRICGQLSELERFRDDLYEILAD